MITSFSGENHFLSNFYPSIVELDNEYYQTVEAAYQAAKTDIAIERQLIREAETPHKAKKLGRKVTIRSNWEKVKEEIMEDLVRQKFSKNPIIIKMLLETGDKELIEGNSWGDVIWGCELINGEWVGKNLLGKLLMKIREEKKNGIN